MDWPSGLAYFLRNGYAFDVAAVVAVVVVVVVALGFVLDLWCTLGRRTVLMNTVLTSPGHGDVSR